MSPGKKTHQPYARTIVAWYWDVVQRLTKMTYALIFKKESQEDRMVIMGVRYGGPVQ